MKEEFYRKFIKENPEEVIIAKLIQNDERAKEILELKKHYEHEQEYINGEVFSSKQMHFIDENYIDKSKVKEKIEDKIEKLKVLAEKSESEELYIRKNQIYILYNIYKDFLEES